MEDLIHLALIWAGVFVAAYLAHKTKLTPVLYYLAFGAAMVNLGLLPEESSQFIRVFAELGIILIMFALGFEENSGNFVRSIRRSWGIAFFGAVAPFFTAYYLTLEFWGNSSLALLCGLAMTATAVSLTMVSLRSENLHTSPAATGIMTSAVIDDIASLALVAIVVPVVTGAGVASASEVGLIVVKTLLFFASVMVLGILVFPSRPGGLFSWVPFMGRLGLQDLLGMAGGRMATLVMLLLALIVGLLAHEFGFHPAVGAYMAGLVLKEEYFHLGTDPGHNRYDETRRIIDEAAFVWIGPVFFVTLGTKLVLDPAILVSVIPETAILTISLFVAQVASASLAARYTGRFSFEESMMIGFGMLGRAELAFVVMDIGYVQHDILSTEAFYTLMFTAFWLNVAVPITIKLWKPYLAGERSFGSVSD